MGDITVSKAPGVRVRAAELLHGALRVTDEGAGWIRPWRFSADQVRALGSSTAWHPGLYRQMAACTSGIVVEFDTDSTLVTLEIRVDGFPSGTQAVARDVAHAQRDADIVLDGISFDVDGTHYAVRQLPEGAQQMTFVLDAPREEGSSLRLPGMGTEHHVVIWLPALTGCELRDIIGDGTHITPVDARPVLFVLGDSIAQGFCAGDPALGWAARVSREWGMDLCNQSIGGQVFQPGMVADVDKRVTPERVIVALGINLRHEPCTERQVCQDVHGLFGELRRIWPTVRMWALTPTPHSEQPYHTHQKSCFERVPGIIRQEATRFDMGVVDGLLLLDYNLELFADGSEHPNARGCAQIAERLSFAADASRLTSSERQTKALEVLDGAPMAAFPIREMIKRGECEVLFADEGCVLVESPPNLQYLYATNRPLARRVMRAMTRPDIVLVALGPEIVRDAKRVVGFDEASPCYLAVYEKTEPIEETHARDIRVLDTGHADAVLAHYSHPGYLVEGELEAMLSQGRMLGGFEDGELVGFIGSHGDGAMGMLEVFLGHRRQGWGRALEAACINRQLERGFTPWGQLWPSNMPSLRLQENLGLTVYPARDMTFLWKREE